MNDDAFLLFKISNYLNRSQTHWRWLELKLTELGMFNNPSFNICFVLDKTSMFPVDGKKVKPLHIVWGKFPSQWGKHNTLHVDDLDRNFIMNPQNGITVSAYYREGTKKKKKKSGADGSSGAGGGMGMAPLPSLPPLPSSGLSCSSTDFDVALQQQIRVDDGDHELLLLAR